MTIVKQSTIRAQKPNRKEQDEQDTNISSVFSKITKAMILDLGGRCNLQNCPALDFDLKMALEQLARILVDQSGLN